MLDRFRSNLKSLWRTMSALRRIRLMEQQNEFLLAEIRRSNELMRYHLMGPLELAKTDTSRTRASFDYQWGEFPTGAALPSDREFMEQVRSQLCEMTDLPPDWFPGKRVVDVGCGMGRFTYGFLALGATVTACDQSDWALKRTAELCSPYEERLSTKEIDLLKWDATEEYDLAFCFGVVHHTGNTYLAIRNVCRKVAHSGRVFLMVYGVPEDMPGFEEVNAYERLRSEMQFVPFDRRREVLLERYGLEGAHGWFDAISPRINDLLTYGETAELLMRLGFSNPRPTRQSRNHHIVADRV